MSRGRRTCSWVNLVAATLILSMVGSQLEPSSAQMLACTTTMMTSLMPCMSFLTRGNSSSSPSPVPSCCKAVGNLMKTSSDCGCMLFSRSMPVGFGLWSSLPIDQNLAFQLPSACGSSSVSLLDCKSPLIPLPPPSVQSPPPPVKAPPPKGQGLKPFVLPSDAVSVRHHDSARSFILALVPSLILLL